jgi:hypothetical protein
VALASSSIVRWSAPIRIIASEPNVPTAINGSGQAVTLRPGSGPGPALQLATAGGPVRTEQLQTTVGGYNDPSVAIAGPQGPPRVWDFAEGLARGRRGTRRAKRISPRSTRASPRSPPPAAGPATARRRSPFIPARFVAPRGATAEPFHPRSIRGASWRNGGALSSPLDSWRLVAHNAVVTRTSSSSRAA